MPDHNSEPVVWQLTPADAPLAARIVAAFHGRPAPAAELARFLSDPANLLVAAVGGEAPIGFLLAHRLPHLRTGSHQYFIYEIEVAPPYRRGGVGTRLLNVVLDRARADRVETFVLTNRSNAAAMRFFEAAGALCENVDDALMVFPPSVASHPDR